MAHILVTGGAGYIGSHTVIDLLNQGYQVLVFDNLECGNAQALERIQKITQKSLTFIPGDLRYPQEIASVFTKYQIDSVIHFAAFKNVGEADQDPYKYYNNNVVGSLNLLEAMQQNHVKKIVFSSTSAIYGESDILPMHENLPMQPKNAYGKSKACVEWMLNDYFNTHQISSVALRYFNAAGAHPSGQLGEDPSRTGNIIPLIMQTLVGKRDSFKLYGNKFNTQDGTQERDYIHVLDLAAGHIAALKKLIQPGCYTYNLGTGQSTSNQQLISLSEKISGHTLKYEVVDPRPGDPAITVSDPRKAQQELGWKATHSIEEIIKDYWNWVSLNPNGYN